MTITWKSCSSRAIMMLWFLKPSSFRTSTSLWQRKSQPSLSIKLDWKYNWRLYALSNYNSDLLVLSSLSDYQTLLSLMIVKISWKDFCWNSVQRWWWTQTVTLHHKTSFGTLSLECQARLKTRSYLTVLITLSIWLTYLRLRILWRTRLETLTDKAQLKSPSNDSVSEIKISVHISLSLTVTLGIHSEMRKPRSQHCWQEYQMSSVSSSSQWTLPGWT